MKLVYKSVNKWMYRKGMMYVSVELENIEEF